MALGARKLSRAFKKLAPGDLILGKKMKSQKEEKPAGQAKYPHTPSPAQGPDPSLKRIDIIRKNCLYLTHVQLMTFSL